MRIARILYPVTVLGPGKRIAIWVAGCSKRCKGCANPELWQGVNYPSIEIEHLEDALNKLYEKVHGEVDGVTISGGEPFEQSEDLTKLVSFLKTRTDDILIFTGKQKAELEKDYWSAQILKEIAVLVDGEYIESQNEGEVLRGSTNQSIHVMNKKWTDIYTAYQKEQEGKHLVENFRVSDGVIAVGIHKKDFENALINKLETKNIFKRNRMIRIRRGINVKEV